MVKVNKGLTFVRSNICGSFQNLCSNLTQKLASLTACQVPALLNATRSAVAAASSPEVQSRVHMVAGVGAQVAEGVGMTASQVRPVLPKP